MEEKNKCSNKPLDAIIEIFWAHEKKNSTDFVVVYTFIHVVNHRDRNTSTIKLVATTPSHINHGQTAHMMIGLWSF